MTTELTLDDPTSTIDQDDPTTAEPSATPAGSPPPTTVILALRDRSVSFTGRQVSSIPDMTGRTDPTGRTVADEAVYLTGKGKVAIHDPVRRTLAVYDLDQFVDRFTTTPVSWIVDDVLAALPHPIEHLDI